MGKKKKRNRREELKSLNAAFEALEKPDRNVGDDKRTGAVEEVREDVESNPVIRATVHAAQSLTLDNYIEHCQSETERSVVRMLLINCGVMVMRPEQQRECLRYIEKYLAGELTADDEYPRLLAHHAEKYLMTGVYAEDEIEGAFDLSEGQKYRTAEHQELMQSYLRAVMLILKDPHATRALKTDTEGEGRIQELSEVREHVSEYEQLQMQLQSVKDNLHARVRWRGESEEKQNAMSKEIDALFVVGDVDQGQIASTFDQMEATGIAMERREAMSKELLKGLEKRTETCSRRSRQ